MKIQWPFLLLALALLMPPIPLSASLRRSLSSSRRKGGGTNTAAALRLWQNWADFARAALGVFILTSQALVVDGSKLGGEMKSAVLTGIVLACVLLIQTIRVMKGLQLLAPVFYLCGVTLIMGGYVQGAFAIAVGWLFAIGGKNLAYQLPAMAVALAAAGYVLGLGLPLLLDCALILLPPILAILFKKRLVFAAVTPALS